MKPLTPECQQGQSDDLAVSQLRLGTTCVDINGTVAVSDTEELMSLDHEGMKRAAQWRQVQLHLTFIFWHKGQRPPAWIPPYL